MVALKSVHAMMTTGGFASTIILFGFNQTLILTGFITEYHFKRHHGKMRILTIECIRDNKRKHPGRQFYTWTGGSWLKIHTEACLEWKFKVSSELFIKKWVRLKHLENHNNRKRSFNRIDLGRLLANRPLWIHTTTCHKHSTDMKRKSTKYLKSISPAPP